MSLKESLQSSLIKIQNGGTAEIAYTESGKEAIDLCAEVLSPLRADGVRYKVNQSKATIKISKPGAKSSQPTAPVEPAPEPVEPEPEVAKSRFSGWNLPKQEPKTEQEEN